MSLLWLLNNKWFPVRQDSTNKWLVSNLFHLRWTKPKANNYNSFIRTIKSTIITRSLGSYNINYYNLLIMTEYINNYNPLTRVIKTKVKHVILLIQTYKTKYYISIIFIFHKQRKCSNIFFIQNIYLIHA